METDCVTILPNGKKSDGTYFETGNVFVTHSKRNTTPCPDPKKEKDFSLWIIENAIAEANYRGNQFASEQFARITIHESKKKRKQGPIAGTMDTSHDLIEYMFHPLPELILAEAKMKANPPIL